MTNSDSAPLQPGEIVQYRKVGQARLVELVEQDRYGTPEFLATNEGWWRVEWIKAPKKYREMPAEQAVFYISRRART